LQKAWCKLMNSMKKSLFQHGSWLKESKDCTRGNTMTDGGETSLITLPPAEACSEKRKVARVKVSTNKKYERKKSKRVKWIKVLAPQPPHRLRSLSKWLFPGTVSIQVPKRFQQTWKRIARNTLRPHWHIMFLMEARSEADTVMARADDALSAESEAGDTNETAVIPRPSNWDTLTRSQKSHWRRKNKWVN
jgi:hypothetical protein